MTTILLVLQLLQASPELFHKESARPFQNVPLEQVAHEFELYKGNEDALVAFQLEEHEALRNELAARFDDADFDGQQRILKALK